MEFDLVGMAGATKNQPPGQAPPPLIPGDPESAEEHIALANAMGPSAMLLTAATPPGRLTVANRCALNPDFAIKSHLGMLRSLRDLPDALTRIRKRWVSAIPPGSPASGSNFPVFTSARRILAM